MGINSGKLPSREHLSTLLATILLALALAQFVDLEPRIVPLQVGGISFAFQINAATIVAVAVAGMTATGMDWLLRSHPKFGEALRVPHWLLPGLTALIISIPLSNLEVSFTWWMAFAASGGLLFAVIIAEYISLDITDSRQPFAVALLTGLSFAIFLILAITLRSINSRLAFILPMVAISAALVNLRVTYLRQPAGWRWLEALGISLLIVQITAALHYMRISPISFGLFLVAPLYAITSVMLGYLEKASLRDLLLEPVIVLVFGWVLALWLR